VTHAARIVVALVLAWGALAVPGAAAELDGAGWWWRAQTGLLQPVPPPPYVPEDGLFVAGAPDGPSAVAAVRYTLGADDAMPELTLQVEHERGGEAAQIVACPTREGWRPTRAGRWDGRPEADCDAGFVDGVRAEDGETWTFALATLVADDRLNVVLMQVPPDEGAPSVFEVAFAGPGPESLSTTPAGSTGGPPAGGAGGASQSSAPPPEFAPPADDGGFDGGGFDGGGDFDAGGGDQSFEAGEPMVADADFDDDGFGDGGADDDVAAPEVAGEDGDGAAGEQAAGPATEGIAVSDGRPDVRTLAMMVALLCVAGFVMLSEDAGRRLVAAGTGGRFGGAPTTVPAEGPVRGLGRFARPREGEAPSLF
jgi:hypothetical protein